MCLIFKEASQKRKWSVGPASSGLDLFIQERLIVNECFFVKVVGPALSEMKLVFFLYCTLFCFSCVGESFAEEEHGDLQDINV